MIVTLYRCYWPTVFKYLQPLKLSRCVQDTFGHVLTIKLDQSHLQTLNALLPIGAIIEVHSAYSYNKDLVEIQDILRAYGTPEQDN